MNREITRSDILEAVWPITEGCNQKVADLLAKYDDLPNKSGPQAHRALEWAETIGGVARVSQDISLAQINISHSVGRLSFGPEFRKAA